MWLFTKYGMYSVVVNRNNIDQVMVRSRKRNHLMNLVSRFSNHLNGTKIITTKDADYRYRIIIHFLVWEKLVPELASIDYCNFKDEAKKLGDKSYDAALGKIWETMWDLQERT